jgi:predicted DsbA family dithiol-disulfide isomerase
MPVPPLAVAPSVRIDIWSDVASRTCYEAKQHLDLALAAYREPVDVVFHAFLEDPDGASTLDAHRLLVLARHEGLQAEVAERLMRAFLIEGRDPSDLFTLADIGIEAGLDGDRVRQWLAGDHGLEEVEEELAAARDIGITVAPTFVINRRYVVQGAQEPPTFLRVLERVARAA